MSRLRPRLVLLAALTVSLVAATACEPAPTVTAPGTVRTILYGDSLPSWLVRDGGSAPAQQAAVTLIDESVPACEGAEGNPVARTVTGALVPTPAECAAGWPALYPPALTAERPGLAIVMSGTHAMLDHKLDGTWRHPCHTPARTWYQGDLEARLRYLATRADKVVIVVPAWPTSLGQWIVPADYVKRADCVRSLVKAAAKNAGAATVDLGTYLCPGGATTCNSWRSKDGIHIDPAKATTVLTWLLTSAQTA